jgi:hypothetical protein
MVALQMVMLDELGHGTAKMALPKRDQLVQAFGLGEDQEQELQRLDTHRAAS